MTAPDIPADAAQAAPVEHPIVRQLRAIQAEYEADEAAERASDPPAIEMELDGDRITFRDQSALDEYVRGALDARLGQQDDQQAADIARRIEAWIRHGEAVPADVTTYERWIVHEELRAILAAAREPRSES